MRQSLFRSSLARLLALALFSVATLLAGGTQMDAASKTKKLWVYVGTYTGDESKGIYLLELDLADGSLKSLGVAAETKNPSFVAIHPNQRLLYSVSEVSDLDGVKTGGVAGFSIDQKTGKLTLLNRQPSGGGGPCHLVVDQTGRNVLVANYGGGSVSALPIQEDGRLKKASAFIQHRGSSVDPRRQGEPHAHSINIDGDNRFAVVADLGLDKVLVYKFDPAKGTLTPNTPPSAAVKPGAGPRHFAFHPNGRNAYVINEIGNTVTTFRYDGEKGILDPIQSISTLPADFEGTSHTAEVQVHPSGKFVYGSNRGHDSIAVYSVNPETGKLTLVEIEPTGGETPRNFGLDPTGQYLLAANQSTGDVFVFSIDQKTGELKATGAKVDVPAPVCLKFMPKPE